MHSFSPLSALEAQETSYFRTITLRTLPIVRFKTLVADLDQGEDTRLVHRCQVISRLGKTPFAAFLSSLKARIVIKLVYALIAASFSSVKSGGWLSVNADVLPLVKKLTVTS